MATETEERGCTSCATLIKKQPPMLKIRRDRVPLEVHTEKKDLEVLVCELCDGPVLKLSKTRAGKAPDDDE
jgi:hypothetical protein